MSRHLGKFEKMWNSPCIAIEDPFDLSHNLGAGISRKMNMFIKTAFIRTRELFGIPSPKIPKFHSKIPIEQLKVCLISRSAHRTPNFTNPEFFVYLLFEHFFQIKVLN